MLGTLILGACGSTDAGDPQAQEDLAGILLASLDGETAKLYVTNAEGVAQLVPTGKLEAYSADWSPDKSQIVFVGNDGDPGNPDLYVMDADGSNIQQILSTPAIEGDATWAPDGHKIYFWQSHEDKTWVVKSLDLESGEVSTVPGTLNGDGQVDVSPSGDHLGVVRNQGGTMSVELLRLGGDAKDISISDGSGALTWSPSGEQLAYTNTRGDLSIYSLDSGESTRVADVTASEVEWGPNEHQLLVISSAPAMGDGDYAFVIDPSTGATESLTFGIDQLDYFGGVSWE